MSKETLKQFRRAALADKPVSVLGGLQPLGVQSTGLLGKSNDPEEKRDFLGYWGAASNGQSVENHHREKESRKRGPGLADQNPLRILGEELTEGGEKAEIQRGRKAKPGGALAHIW